MASTSARRRTARARRPLPQPADPAMPSKSVRRRSARARRALPHPGDRATPSTSARRRSARGPASQTFLPDELWEEVFLRLDAAADLAHASAACFSFRCIVSDPRFRRRLRSLRPPAVLGFISSDRSHRFLPVGVGPSLRSAPEARVLEQAADFTFSFLPNPSAWRPRHTRDGRVLLSRRISTKTQFEDFIVCDPLHRRYVKIPRIPDDFMASMADNGIARLPVLVPAGENEESFRVICTLRHKDQGKVMVLVFSFCDQTWRGIMSTICLPNNGFIVWKPYYAHGCLYWMFYRMGYALMVDTSEMKFSIIDLPSYNFGSQRAIVGAEEGRLGLLTIRDDTIDLYWKNGQSNGVGAQEWQYDKLIQLPRYSGIKYTNWTIVGTVGRYLTLKGCRHVFLRSLELKSDYFVLDTKTLLLEMVCTWSNVGFLGIPYARSPPFALPSI